MNASRALRYTGLGLLVAVLAFGPFFQGLFFWTELLAAIVAVAVGFVLWLLGRRLGGFAAGVPGGATGWGLLALLACYLLQFAWAVYPRGNIDWVLRVAAAWMVYVMVRAEAGAALRRWLGWLFVLSAAGVAVMGLLEYSGYFAENAALIDALNIVNLGDRMYTPLQYPNTAAAYLLAAAVTALGLALEDLRPWKAGVSAGLMVLLSLAFFFTLSRGAVVVLPFGLLALFVGLRRGKRMPALLLLAAAWVPVLAVVRSVGPAAAANQVSVALSWAAGASATGLLGGALVPLFLSFSRRIRLALVVGGLLTCVSAIAVVLPRGGLIPPQAERLLDLNLRTFGAQYRLALFEDAREMIRDRPLGRGGWGWERSYRQYQDTYYIGQETHNHYLQTAVEAGIPGLVALGVAIAAGIWAVWRRRGDSSLTWCMAAGAILIAGHSVIEFNLSFGLAWLLFWTLLASGAEPDAVEPGGAVAIWGILAASMGVAGFGVLLLVGSWYVDTAKGALAEGRTENAVALAERAAQFDRWSSEPLLIVGSREALERAVRLDPNLARGRWELSILLEHQRDLEGSLEQARATVAKAPLHDVYVQRLASLLGKQMVDGLHNGDLDKASGLAEELVALGDGVERSRSAEGPWMQPRPTLTPESRLRYGQALFLMGRQQEAEIHLKAAARVGLLGSEADVWLYALYERTGNQDALAQLKEKPWIRFLHVNPVYKVISTLS